MKALLQIIVLLVVIPAVAVAAPEPQPFRVDSGLKDVLWQAFPVGVRGVCVGPDQRLWYSVHRRGDPPRTLTLSECEKIIRREFDKPNPQIPALISMELFEPNGRAWFKNYHATTGYRLVSYDGKRWIDAPTIRPLNMSPSPPYLSGQFAVAADEMAFFACTGGVHWFDGDSFRLHETLGPTKVFPEGDGKGVIAISLGRENRSILYRWRDGAWKTLEGDPGKNVWYFAALPGKGVYCVAEDRRLRLIPFDKDAAATENKFGPYDLHSAESVTSDGHGTVYVLGKLADASEQKGWKNRVVLSCTPDGQFHKILEHAFDPARSTFPLKKRASSPRADRSVGAA